VINTNFLFIDFATNLWVATVFIILFIWLPSKVVFSSLKQNWDNRIVSYLARTLFVIIVGVALLSVLSLFGWLTLVLLYFGFLFLGWRYSYNSQEKWNFPQQIWEKLILVSVDLLDRGFSLKRLEKIALGVWQRSQKNINFIIATWQLNRSQGMLGAIALTTSLAVAFFLRYEYPLQQLRFGHPDAYHYLLVTRQILTRDLPQISNLRVFSIIVAVISLLGSIDPMQVVRFLAPLLSFLLVLSVGYCVRNLTQTKTAALAAMYGFGAYLFTWNWKISDRLPQWWQEFLVTIKDNLNSSLIRQWTGGDFEIGAIFLLLALGTCNCIFERKNRQEASLTTICCLIIVAIASPTLLILALIGSIGLIAGKRLALALVSIVWTSLALISAIPNNPLQIDRLFLVTLPIALSLLLGLLFLVTNQLLKIILEKWSELTCLILIFAISINFLLPIAPKINYLEYESAARKSLEIRSLFPVKRWVIVAPVEQLAQNYGFGWYEDLAVFTKRYADKVNKTNFKFPYSVPDLFVFVEVRPFVSRTDLQSLPYSLLSDPTFSNYRSSVGRASLEFEALKLCEDYLRNHGNGSVYYEDKDLKIYHFRLD
jgi:hypothetical protein